MQATQQSLLALLAPEHQDSHVEQVFTHPQFHTCLRDPVFRKCVNESLLKTSTPTHTMLRIMSFYVLHGQPVSVFKKRCLMKFLQHAAAGAADLRARLGIHSKSDTGFTPLELAVQLLNQHVGEVPSPSGGVLTVAGLWKYLRDTNQFTTPIHSFFEIIDLLVQYGGRHPQVTPEVHARRGAPPSDALERAYALIPQAYWRRREELQAGVVVDKLDLPHAQCEAELMHLHNLLEFLTEWHLPYLPFDPQVISPDPQTQPFLQIVASETMSTFLRHVSRSIQRWPSWLRAKYHPFFELSSAARSNMAGEKWEYIQLYESVVPPFGEHPDHAPEVALVKCRDVDIVTVRTLHQQRCEIDSLWVYTRERVLAEFKDFQLLLRFMLAHGPEDWKEGVTPSPPSVDHGKRWRQLRATGQQHLLDAFADTNRPESDRRARLEFVPTNPQWKARLPCLYLLVMHFAENETLAQMIALSCIEWAKDDVVYMPGANESSAQVDHRLDELQQEGIPTELLQLRSLSTAAAANMSLLTSRVSLLRRYQMLGELSKKLSPHLVQLPEAVRFRSWLMNLRNLRDFTTKPIRSGNIATIRALLLQPDAERHELLEQSFAELREVMSMLWKLVYLRRTAPTGIPISCATDQHQHLDEALWMDQVEKFYASSSVPRSSLLASSDQPGVESVLKLLTVPAGSSLKLKDAKSAWKDAFAGDPAVLTDSKWKWRTFLPAAEPAASQPLVAAHEFVQNMQQRSASHPALRQLMAEFDSRADTDPASAEVLLRYILDCGNAISALLVEEKILPAADLCQQPAGSNYPDGWNVRVAQGAAIRCIAHNLPFSHTLDFCFAQCMQALHEVVKGTNKDLEEWRASLKHVPEHQAIFEKLAEAYNDPYLNWRGQRLWVDHGDATLDAILTPLRSVVTYHDENIFLVVWTMCSDILPLIKQLQSFQPVSAASTASSSGPAPSAVAALQ
ncbi:hypothetical protein DFJ77DRAFT_163753 [Powellomyces hirtus]|nr:hypothetical protein DFJ77DRAFT_163753 [Powellomyces hirtus]